MGIKQVNNKAVAKLCTVPNSTVVTDAVKETGEMNRIVAERC